MGEMGYLRNQPVAVAVGQLDRLVLEEEGAEEGDGEGGDLHVARVLARRQHARAHRELVRASAPEVAADPLLLLLLHLLGLRLRLGRLLGRLLHLESLHRRRHRLGVLTCIFWESTF